MPEPPRQRGSIPPPVLAALDHKLEGEVEVLESLVNALARNNLAPEMWQRLFDAAARDSRQSELAFAFETVLQEKRMKTLPAATVGEFMFRASVFFGEFFGDDVGAITYLERTLATVPTHAGAFERLEGKLIAKKDHKRLAELYIDLGQHRQRAEQAQLLRQATAALAKVPDSGDRIIELEQQILKLDPADEGTRRELASQLAALGRTRDVVRVLEQGLLVTDPPPSDDAARHMRSRLIELYADELGEVEKAVPHVEALLALDPANEKARQVGERLLELKGVAARAASALAEAYGQSGDPLDVARYLAIELEHTRGAKRRDVLRRLGILRQDRLQDPAGAFDVLEQALTLDPADDDLRVRYLALAMGLGRQLDAARVLGKVATTAKDAPVRARLSADMAELFLSGGDRKRARAVFAGVLTQAGAESEAIVKAARALAALYEADGEVKPLGDVLDKLAQLETEPDRLRFANEKLAELCEGPLEDPARAATAWRRVLDGPSRARALARLEALYAEAGSPADLAFVLEERSKDAPANEARELLGRAATQLAEAGDAPRAAAAWRRMVERFGPSRAAYASLVPLLESTAQWKALAEALEEDATLAPESERGPLLARAGSTRLSRLRDVPGAIDAFRRALASDAGEKTSRAALEKLLAAGEHRVAAAAALEPLYRAEESLAGLLRVLDVRASLSTEPSARLAALDEAARVAEGSPPHRAQALEFAGRGLAEATAHDQPIESWIERVLMLSSESDAKRRAALLAKALGERAIDNQALLLLARHTGDALAAVGDVQAAVGVFRRALAYDPSSSELLGRVDALLRDQGNPEERLSLYRRALENETAPAQRRRILHALGAIERHELKNLKGAIQAYRTALTEGPDDRDAHAALAELYAEVGSFNELVELLEAQIARLSGAEALDVRGQLAQIAALHSEPERAEKHCRAMLDDAALTVEHLDQIEKVADVIADSDLTCAALERRAAAAGDPRDAVAALDRLGTVHKDQRANVPEAQSAWRRAARLSEESNDPDTARRLYERLRKVAPDDLDATSRLAALLEAQGKWSALPELYAILVAAAPDDTTRCSVLLRQAQVLADRLGDLSGATEAAAHAFTLDPSAPETVAAFERIAVLAGATALFTKTIDTAMVELGEDQALLVEELKIAKARVLAKDPQRVDDAAALFRDLVGGAALDTTRTAALEGFEKLLDAAESAAEARNDDRRWLLEWKAEQAHEAERVGMLLAWARAEETTFGDVERALGLHRRVLELDPENAEASAGVARLTLATGDVGGAIAALFARREKSDGAARRALDLEIATILIERNEQLEDALRSITSLLEESADDADAVALAARLLRLPLTESNEPFAREAAAALERACSKVVSPEVRATILSALLEAPAGIAGPETRREWFERLAEAHRAQGKLEAALLTTLRAAEEMPAVSSLWDAAEELARSLKSPGGVADLYHRVIGQQLSPDEAMELGQRAVAFHEEWFDDAERIVSILERVLALDPAGSWAFDRLKLLYDAREQWDDLFGLYDRAIAAADPDRRVELLEDVAQIAKDFANHSERAIGYLEQLLPLRPKNARIIASLERLYERHGKFRELIALLSTQLSALSGKDGRDTRIRIATMTLDQLGEPAAALAVVEEVLAPDPRESPQLSVLGDPNARPRLQVVELLERILSAAPAGQEIRESMLPPPLSDGGGNEGRSPTSMPPPPRARAKRTPVRQRAAALLKEHYLETGRDASLANVLEVELEAVKSIKERIRRHQQLAELHVRLKNDVAALDHYVSLVTLEPDVAEHRAALMGISERVGRFERVAEVLTTAADDCTDDGLRVELLMQAAVVHEERLSEPTRAIELYGRVLSVPRAGAETLLAASRRIEPLLAAAGRNLERLGVLERIADLDGDPSARRAVLGAAARLAAELDENDRAISAWEQRLRDDATDLEALDGLVALFEHGEQWAALVGALTRRTESRARSEAERRDDHVRIAHIQRTYLAAPESSIEAWRVIVRDFGPDEETTTALADLLRETERWGELAELLEEAAKREKDAAVRAVLLRKHGDVLRERLDDAAGSVAVYAAALADDPREVGALAGLHSLLARETERGPAVRALLATYTSQDDWERVLDLTEPRLLAAESDEARVAVLKEAAKIAEGRGARAEMAYELVCRAYALAPIDLDLEGDLFRLAELTGGWRAFAEVHRRIIDALEARATADEKRDPELLARLRIHLGEALELRLDDPRGALSAYLRAVADSPRDLLATQAAVRVAGPNMRWDAAAKVILQYALSSSVLDEALFATLESVATSPAAWDGITGAFANAIAERDDLPAPLARDLEARVAAWHRDRRGDPDAAEAAFTRALSYDGLNADILAALAQLQRRAKGRPLVDSLLRLSQATGGDLELLREAAEIATGAVADRALAKSILERLMKSATEAWLGSDRAEDAIVTSGGNSTTPEAYIRWAIAELSRIHNEEGDAERIVDLLVESSRLPFDAETRRSMRHEAARVAENRLGDSERAIALYAALFQEDSSDTSAADRLAELYQGLGRNEALLTLRRRQVELAEAGMRRLALRLEVASLEVGLGREAEARATLRANLKEEPRHVETVAALERLLVAKGEALELSGLLAEQAELSEAAGDFAAAGSFWSRAAKIAEEQIKDDGAAIGYHARVVRLGPDAASFDALARLSAARHDFTGAAEYLTQLRECAPREERVGVTLRLAGALSAAGRDDAAEVRLEQAIAEDPSAEPIRARLAEVYRQKEAFVKLATLLAGGADHVANDREKLTRLREAADLFRFQCKMPASAVPLLERAAQVEPNDRAIQLTLADTLGAAGRLEEARALLRTLIDGFGGRRPKERAPVHYHLALLDLRAGDRAQALGELEAATKIDPANPEILRALAELARDDGQLERAERSYRALLAVVRRQEDPEESAPVVRSEVLLELSEIAARQGENERAHEIRESALEAAAGHPVEAARLERALRERNDYATLAKALELRLAKDESSPRAVSLLLDLADVVGNKLGRPEDALAVALRAVQNAPGSDAAHDAVLAYVKKGGGASVLRYVETVEEQARRAEEEGGDVTLAARLHLRLGTAVKEELGDDARAVGHLERAERLAPDSGEVLRALEEIHARLGDRVRQGEVLERLVALEQERHTKEPAKIADALLRLAGLRLADGDVDATTEVITRALEQDPGAPGAAPLLERAADQHPASEAILALYERVGRRPGADRVLLDALRRRAELAAPPPKALREAIQLAHALGETATEERLLRRYVEVASSHDGEESHAVWAHLALATLLTARGEGREALTLRLRAADLASDEEARKLRFEAAHEAESVHGDLETAASTYEAILASTPGDRAAWGPLLTLYPRLGREDRLAALIGQVVDAVDDDKERTRLLLARAKILLGNAAAEDEAASTLRRIVDDDPSQEEAAMLLADLLERRGETAELTELLRRLLDAAKDREDPVTVSSISRRLGALLKTSSPTDAIEVYRAALDWDPSNEHILRSLLILLGEHGDAAERAEVVERLLEVVRGPEAEALALEIAAVREEAWDQEGVERALALGYRAHPTSATLRDRLTTIYRERNDWAKLAELAAVEAQGVEDPAKRATLLRAAAQLYRERLSDAERAATLLKEARAAAPNDTSIVSELVAALTESKQYQAAASELTAAAAHLAENDPGRAGLLAQRASLRAALGDHGGALYDLERAYALDPTSYFEALKGQLEELRRSAEQAGDTAKECALVLRLTALLRQVGRVDEAREHLTSLLTRDPSHRDALRGLASLEESLEHWQAAAAALSKLVALEDNAELTATALRLATACERAGDLPRARLGLEQALGADPTHVEVRTRLRDVYEKIGAYRELAEMSLAEARATEDPEQRFSHLVRGASILVGSGSEPVVALAALEEAHAMRPNDIEATALLSDAHVLLGQRGAAVEVLQGCLATHKGRRSRDLAILHHRLARLEIAVGNPAGAMTWLSSALDMDGQNGLVASELAECALQQGHYDLATKALRAVTMLKVPAPLPRAVAYQKLGEIAHHQGDTKKAVLLLRRAVDDDPTLESAKQLLASLQGH